MPEGSGFCGSYHCLDLSRAIPVCICLYRIGNVAGPPGGATIPALLGFGLVWYGAVFYFTKTEMPSLYKDLSIRDKFLKNHSRTTAKILERRVSKLEDQYSRIYYTFHLQMRFIPVQVAGGPGTLTVRASIGEQFYKRLENCDSINIIYAVDDPMMFLIQGE